MKAPLATVAAVLLLATPAVADTLIPGGGVGGQTWTAAGSPYRVSGSISIAAGTTLVIQAGARVEIAPSPSGSTSFFVGGTLEVNGTAAAPVVITGDPTPGSWRGINAGQNAHLRLDHVTLDYPQNGVEFGAFSAGERLISTGLTVRHAIAGLRLAGETTATLDRFTAIDAILGVYLTGAGVKLTNCLIVGGPRSLVGVSATSGGFAGPTGSYDVELVNCTIDGASRSGIEALARDDAARIDLTVTNTIVSRGGGRGIAVSAIDGGTASARIEHSNVWGNAGGNYAELAAPGVGTISQDPSYLSPTDWHLAAGSPSVDVGTDLGATDHDLDGAPRPRDGDAVPGARFDQGAYERTGAAPRCGDGAIDRGETCDDGNQVDGDGCDASCASEAVDAGPDAAGPDARAPDAPLAPDAGTSDPGDGGDGGGCSTGGAAAGAPLLAVAIGLLARRRRRM